MHGARESRNLADVVDQDEKLGSIDPETATGRSALREGFSLGDLTVRTVEITQLQIVDFGPSCRCQTCRNGVGSRAKQRLTT